MTDPTPTPAPAEQPAPPSSAMLARVQKGTAATRIREGGEAWVFGFRDQVAELLAGRVRDVDGYLYNAFRQIAASEALSSATRTSLAGGLLLGATLGFEIGGPLGHFYLTPRWNSRAIVQRSDGTQGQGANECVPVIGYRGFFELGYRTGRIQTFEYVRVREGDHFEIGADSERGNWYEWKPLRNGGDARPLTDVVAVAKLLDGGGTSHLAMTIEQIHDRRPSNWQRTPWGNAKFADAMATKTPHRELAKFMRLSTDLALAVDADERISLWNRETEAIETRHGDDDAAIIVASDGNAAEPAAEEAPAPVQGESVRESAPAPQARTEAHTAADVHPRDLRALADAEGRELTEAEFDRLSAWEAEQQP